MLSKLLETTAVPLTTIPAKVMAPEDMEFKAMAVVAGCRASGKWVEWERQAAVESSVSSPCIDSKEALGDLSVNPGQTPFYAKMASGTGTLYVEWWG